MQKAVRMLKAKLKSPIQTTCRNLNCFLDLPAQELENQAI